MTGQRILIGCGALLALGVVVILAALIGSVVGGGGGTSQSPPPSPPASDSEDEAKKTEAKKKEEDSKNVEVAVGETAELRDRTLVVNEVERNYFPPSRFTRIEPGNELVRVYITLRNTGDQAFSYNPLDFEVQDSNGIQRKPETITELPYRLEFGDLAPGGTLEGNMVFEVPQGDNRLSLIYETDIVSKRTVTVPL